LFWNPLRAGEWWIPQDLRREKVENSENTSLNSLNLCSLWLKKTTSTQACCSTPEIVFNLAFHLWFSKQLKTTTHVHCPYNREFIDALLWFNKAIS